MRTDHMLAGAFVLLLFSSGAFNLSTVPSSNSSAPDSGLVIVAPMDPDAGSPINPEPGPGSSSGDSDAPGAVRLTDRWEV